MKKFILAPLALVAAMASHTSFAQSTSFEGWSVAAGLSTGGANTKITPLGSDASIDLGKTNTVGVLDLAYGLALNKDIVLGLGATLDLGKSSAGNLGILGGGQDARLTAKNHYSVYVQPTWLLTPSTGVFAKVGYHHFKPSIDGLEQEIPSGMLSSNSGTGFGIGVKTFVSPNVFVQAELLTVSFRSKTYEDAVTLKTKASTGVFSVGYRF